MLKELRIEGFRGFSTPESFRPSIPSGSQGSGLTLLVGPNNSGKSTVIEALASRKPQGTAPSFNVGIRNRKSDLVRLEFEFEDHTEVVRSVRAGSSESVQENVQFDDAKVFVVPSRRHFTPYFGKSGASTRDSYRNTYITHGEIRSSILNYFEGRLLEAERNHSHFNPILKRLLPDLIDWSIDQNESGQYYLKFTSSERSHSSAGVGDGIVSAFVIMSAVYDSIPGETIIIDEPELSLHPQVQRRLCTLLEEYAADRQIILATHSPYFVSPEALRNGAKVCRCWDRHDRIEIHSASILDDCGLSTLLSIDVQKPHLFGLDAREVFFIDDKVVVLEGQEDVVFWPRAMGSEFAESYSVFGWGAGGASNIGAVLKLLRCLGFQKVVAVLDNDVPKEAAQLTESFPEFLIEQFPAPDIRTKKGSKARDPKVGLLDDDNQAVRPEHLKALDALKTAATTYMNC